MNQVKVLQEGERVHRASLEMAQAMAVNQPKSLERGARVKGFTVQLQPRK